MLQDIPESILSSVTEACLLCGCSINNYHSLRTCMTVLKAKVSSNKWMRGCLAAALLHDVSGRTYHLDSGRRCQCRDLPLCLSDVVAGSRAGGGPRKEGC